MNIAEIFIFSAIFTVVFSTISIDLVLEPNNFLSTDQLISVPEFQIKDCKYDKECGPTEICIYHKCIATCEKLKCYENEECQFQINNTVICECSRGFLRDPHSNVCEKKECEDENECGPTETCENHKCYATCRNSRCHKNEYCEFHSDNTVTCECLNGYLRNATSNLCEKPACAINKNCLMSELYVKGNRINICNAITCTSNEGCFTSRKVAGCKCAPGYMIKNTTTQKCEKWCGGTFYGGESHDKDCDDPCDKVSCGENEICQVHINNNTYSCECDSGYVRDQDEKCVIKTKSECTIDRHCHSSEICKNNECISACIALKCNNVNKHTLKSSCLAYDHAAICACKNNALYDFKSKQCIPIPKKIINGGS